MGNNMDVEKKNVVIFLSESEHIFQEIFSSTYTWCSQNDQYTVNAESQKTISHNTPALTNAKQAAVV